MSGPDTTLEWLADHLYGSWFCRTGSPYAESASADSETEFSPSLAARLNAVHAASEQFDSGWIVVETYPFGTVKLAKGDRILLASPPDYVASENPTVPVTIGSDVAVSKRCEGLDETGAWWVTIGIEGPVPAGPMIRVYWNCPPAAVDELVARLTRVFEDGSLPYTLKCPSAPALFARVDAVVLYVDVDDWATVKRSLAAVHALIETRLRNAVPPLTLCLGKGLAVAEDVGGAFSFGQSRARAVAEGILYARANRSSDDDSCHDIDPVPGSMPAPSYERDREDDRIVATVLDRFDAHHICRTKPYLCIGSKTRLSFR